MTKISYLQAKQALLDLHIESPQGTMIVGYQIGYKHGYENGRKKQLEKIANKYGYPIEPMVSGTTPETRAIEEMESKILLNQKEIDKLYSLIEDLRRRIKNLDDRTSIMA